MPCETCRRRAPEGGDRILDARRDRRRRLHRPRIRRRRRQARPCGHGLEAAPRVMMRAISEPMSRAFEAKHRFARRRLRLGEGVKSLIGDAGRVTGVETASGARSPPTSSAGRRRAGRGSARGGGRPRDRERHRRRRGAARLRTGIFAVGDNIAIRTPSSAAGCGSNPCRTRSIRRAPWRGRSPAGPPPTARCPGSGATRPTSSCRSPACRAGLTRHVLRGEPGSGAFSVFGYEGDRLASSNPSIVRPTT